MSKIDGEEPRRDSYRHGDLHDALLRAGLDMARAGGPDAVILREATRRAGVAPNAAYRHFADRQALLDAVSSSAQGRLAVAIELRLAEVGSTGGPADLARARLRAVGLAYLTFARTEPGLFRAAFLVPADLDDADSADKGGAGGVGPFGLLAAVLDEWVAAGIMPPDRRANAEFCAWSAVHGLATLCIDGPLRELTDAQVGVVGDQLLDMVEQGLAALPASPVTSRR